MTAVFLFFWILVVGTAAGFARYYAHRQAKLGQLICKYKDREIAERIVRRELWQGQTDGQLHDSLGPPSAVDHMLRGYKKREVWKYGARGANRFRLRIILEDGSVTTWDREGREPAPGLVRLSGD